ncbi:MAG: hypothetical protein ACXVY8_09340, partial [Gaiellaceae bacterium]
YLITASPDVDSGTTIGVHPWVGDDSFGFNKDYPLALTWADGVATITLNRSALGGTGKFSFQFSALSGIDPSTDNMDNVASDDAPNDGFYSFDTGLPPIAQPVATRLLVTDSLLVPAKPKAGKGPSSPSYSGPTRTRCRPTAASPAGRPPGRRRSRRRSAR